MQLDSGDGELLVRDDGRPFRGGYGTITWLDSHRFVFWDGELDGTVVWDSRSGTARLLSDIPGPAEFDFTDDGRRIFFNTTLTESNIWMLTLGD